MTKPAILALADGTLFHGRSIGADGQSVGEVVFNTSMTGYQEILSDPSYARQIVTLTYPHIGNTGVTDLDNEAAHLHSAGLVIRDLPIAHSNWRAQGDLSTWLKAHGVIAIADVDTRMLTRQLRNQGAQAGCLIAGNAINEAQALEQARAFGGLAGMDLAKQVSCRTPYRFTEGSWQLEGENAGQPFAPVGATTYKVVAYDFGAKRNMLRLLVDRGCELTVVPATTPASEVLAMKPDGVFLSNGPGDPEPCDYAIDAIAEILAQGLPTFGICLGHQLLSLASGAQTKKMKFGHHGANHPVQDLATKQVHITSQNHGFAVDETSLPAQLKMTHRSLFDGSLQGVERTDCPAFSFQGHPEASPGPHDIHALFDRFIALMDAQKAQ